MSQTHKRDKYGGHQPFCIILWVQLIDVSSVEHYAVCTHLCKSCSIPHIYSINAKVAAYHTFILSYVKAVTLATTRSLPTRWQQWWHIHWQLPSDIREKLKYYFFHPFCPSCNQCCNSFKTHWKYCTLQNFHIEISVVILVAPYKHRLLLLDLSMLHVKLGLGDKLHLFLHKSSKTPPPLGLYGLLLTNCVIICNLELHTQPLFNFYPGLQVFLEICTFLCSWPLSLSSTTPSYLCFCGVFNILEFKISTLSWLQSLSSCGNTDLFFKA